MEEYATQLDKLVEKHLKKADENGQWIDYLKAHGIANYLGALDPTNGERNSLVYDIENRWYKGRHPQTYTEHKDLNNKHKQMLNDYREKTRLNFDSLRSQQESLDIEDIFSEDNLNRAEEFSSNIFLKSRACSDGFIGFSGSIIESSVISLRDAGLVPPFSFGVMALGSVARGEATPYSDLEYAFLIDEDTNKEYFEKLAIDTYFKTGNLRESPLKTFDICVENTGDHPSPLVGFRIDGISSKAGNIPTGNGYGTALTFTVSQAMDLYIKEVMSPPGENTGDLSDLLSTSVLIYSFEGGNLLHETFLTQRQTYEERTAQVNLYAKRKRLSTLSQDLKNYDFLPDFQFNTILKPDVKVKTDIFRYPTLLATSLNISLGLNLLYPWDTYRKISELGIVSTKSLRYLNIFLGLSIYIRTHAYLAMGTQSTHLSLHTSAADSKIATDRYYVPRNIFVTLGCLLIPIKQSITSSLYKGYALRFNLGEVSMESYLKSIVQDFQVDTHDLMIKSEVLCFVGDTEAAMKRICRESGVDIAKSSCNSFIEIIREKYGTSKSDPQEKKYLKIVCWLTMNANHYETAIDYLSWLVSYEKHIFSIVQWKMIMSDCLNKLHKYKAAKTILIQVAAIL